MVDTRYFDTYTISHFITDSSLAFVTQVVERQSHNLNPGMSDPNPFSFCSALTYATYEISFGSETQTGRKDKGGQS